MTAVKIKVRAERPAGYRILGAVVAETDKAVRVSYYDWLLWLPKSAVVRVRRGPLTAPAWAIDEAKEHASAGRT